MGEEGGSREQELLSFPPGFFSVNLKHASLSLFEAEPFEDFIPPLSPSTLANRLVGWKAD